MIEEKDIKVVPCKWYSEVKYQIENFNYLNVAFISYNLTMWDPMLFSDGHKASWPTSKHDRRKGHKSCALQMVFRSKVPN